MSKNRYSARTDENQKEIVKELRRIPGVKVEVDHDDIFVGYKGRNFWYEIKNTEELSKKTGKIKESAKKDSQKELEKSWTGHYEIVWSLDQILEEIGL